MEDMLEEAKTVVLFTHSLNIVEKACTLAIWLHHGNIINNGNHGEKVALYKICWKYKNMKQSFP